MGPPTPGRSSRSPAADLRTRPAPREWSVLLCLAHIADAELVMAGRYRWVLAHDEPELIGYDQDLWVDNLHTDDDDPEALLGAVRSAPRGERRALARSSDAADRARVGRPPRARSGELRPDVPDARRPRPRAPRPGTPRARGGQALGRRRRATRIDGGTQPIAWLNWPQIHSGCQVIGAPRIIRGADQRGLKPGLREAGDTVLVLLAAARRDPTARAGRHAGAPR